MPINLTFLRMLRPRQWLSDLYIKAAFVLLRELNPQVGGLFNLYIDGYCSKFPRAKGNRWIQTINNGEGHELLAKKVFFTSNCTRKKVMALEAVNIFDSLYDEVNQLVLVSEVSLLKQMIHLIMNTGFRRHVTRV